MKTESVVFAIGFALGVIVMPGPVQGKARAGYTHGVANAALVAAAKAATLKAIDYDEERCRNDRTVEAWLRELTAGNAKAVSWTGGPCVLSNDLNPLDSGSSWCAQAAISLVRPKNHGDRPMVEIYFEEPTKGRPGKAYAFRGEMLAADGENYSRFRHEFEYDWVSRFPASKAVTHCPEDEVE